MEINLKEFGYNNYFSSQFNKLKESSLIPARIISQTRTLYNVVCEKGFLSAKLSNILRQNAVFKSELPAVGDWVAISVRRDKAYISHVFERKSCITRKTSGKVFDEQVLSSNIDILFIVSSLNEDYNINRLCRYISLAKTGKVKPVILLSKSDLVDDSSPFVSEVKTVASEIPVHSVSVKDAETMTILENYLKTGLTAAFVGSSGVGKSTLINMLLRENRQKTNEISEAIKKGKHTTSSREIILLQNGGIVIDNPGIRELQVWNEDIETGFEDLMELAKDCRFFDCLHDTEPGCAVKEAVENGLLEQVKIEKWKEHKAEVEQLHKMKELSAKIFEKRKVVKKKS